MGCSTMRSIRTSRYRAMSPNQCPQCGTGRLFAAEEDRLCPKCLLELGLDEVEGPLDIGAQIDHYQILGDLGSGGMGHVYLAKDTKLNREVALKVLSGSISSDSADLVRFRREAQALAALKHPNVVTVYSVEESDSAPYIVMELVEGVTLDTILEEGGLEPSRFFELAREITEAIAAAHAKGIVHRDLKPTNLMLDSDGAIKVLDFGLAKSWAPAPGQLSTATATEAGLLVGTVPYMSPEQLEGAELDARSDVFSLGIVLYEMATSKHPFESPTAAGTISAILRDEPPPLRESRQELSPHLEEIVSRCLQKKPEDRYSSAAQLSEDLEALESVSSILSSPESDQPWVRALSWDRSWPFITAALLLILSIGIFVQRAKQPDPATPASTSRDASRATALEDGGVAPERLPVPSTGSESPESRQSAVLEEDSSGSSQEGDRQAAADQRGEPRSIPADISGSIPNEQLRVSVPPVAEAHSFMVEATLYRSVVSGSERLATGSRVRPGDRLFMRFEASQSVYVYVLNEDDLGEVFVLFPIRGVELRNPIQARVRHRLPGSRAGELLSWQVSSAGGEEHLLVIASLAPLEELEGLLRGIPSAAEDDTTYISVPDPVIAAVRGIGGLIADKNQETALASSSLFSQVQGLVDGPESSMGIWIRRIDLKNPL